MFGLSQIDLDTIIAELSQFPAIEEARIFGSRAKGCQRVYSDIDLVLYGPEISVDVLTGIMDTLNEESPMPYFFDVIAYDTLRNGDLKKEIDHWSHRIYIKDGG